MKDSSDQTLIARCIDNDVAAQREIYGRYKNRMMAFCLRYFNRKDLADDFFQEGFIRFFKTLDKYDPAYPLFPWMKKIFLRSGINYLKKYYRFDNKISAMETETFTPESKLSGVLEKLAHQDILQQIEALSKEDGLMINLALIEGLEHKEIAELLGITVNNSRIRLMRARKKFTERWQQTINS